MPDELETLIEDHAKLVCENRILRAEIGRLKEDSVMELKLNLDVGDDIFSMSPEKVVAEILRRMAKEIEYGVTFNYIGRAYVDGLSKGEVKGKEEDSIIGKWEFVF